MATRFESLPRRRRRGAVVHLTAALTTVALAVVALSTVMTYIHIRPAELPAQIPTPPLDPFMGVSLSYRDDSGYEEDVQTAVADWNSIGARVRLVPAAEGRTADILIRTISSRRRVDWAGRTWVSCDTAAGPCRPRGPQTVLLNPVHMRDRDRRLAIVAHELGHALGQPHRHDCSIMRPSGPIMCAGRTVCGPELTDALVLVRLWGGNITADFQPRACDSIDGQESDF